MSSHSSTTDMFCGDQFNTSMNSSGVRLRSRPASAQSRSAWQTVDYGDGQCNPAMDFEENGPAAMEQPFPTPRIEDIEVEEPHGCWYNFSNGIRSFWATRHTEDTFENQDLYIKTTLRELIVYIFFLLIIMIITFGMIGSTMFTFTNTVNALFLDTTFPNSTTTFRTASTVYDFWTFTQNTMLDGLYWDTWYNNANLSNDETNFILYESKLLGAPRIRQLKVRPDSCAIPSDFKTEISYCYSMYAPSVEDKRPFGWANSTAWNHTDANKTGLREYSGLISTYGAGGFYIDLKRNRDDTAAIINELFNGLWIDRGTRVVFIDFTIYNANINLFCVIKLIMEFPATGGAIPSWNFRTVKLIRYVDPMDYFILACEAIFMIFICYYIIEEIIEIKKHRLSYFKSVWSLLDIFVIAISLICAVFNIYRTMAVGKIIKQLLASQDSFPDFDFISYWQIQFNNAIGAAVFFAWIKIFKYISFNKTMTQLSSTLGRCAKDLFGFAIMFFIIFFAFAQLGYLMFGTQVKDFREFKYAIYTLFRIILGDFDFGALENANRVLGPLYFIMYVFFVFFVLINMFLAIINDTYSEVKEDLVNQPNEFEVGDYFKKRAEAVMKKLNLKRDKVVDIQMAMRSADSDHDHRLQFEEWRAELKARGYADNEIEAVFAKFDINGDRVLDEDEQMAMNDELEGMKTKLSHQITNEDKPVSPTMTTDETDSGNRRVTNRPDVQVEQFAVLSKRVDRMEISIDGIVNKIDNVLMKLDLVEKVKSKSRDTMSHLLDGITDSPNKNSDDALRRVVLDEFENGETAKTNRSKGANKKLKTRSKNTNDSTA